MTKREIMTEALCFRYPEFKSFSDAFKLYVADQILSMDEDMDIDRAWDMFEYEFNAERATMHLLAMPDYFTIHDFLHAGTDIEPNAKGCDYQETVRDMNDDREVTEPIFMKLQEYSDIIDDDDKEKILAFILHKELTLGDLNGDDDVISIDNNIIEYNGEEWLILDENEADGEALEYAEQYAGEAIDELFQYRKNDNLRYYFDTDRYADAILSDGRGALLSSYDGIEHDKFVNKRWYFLYRTN
jgi:hypothetical protein